MGGLSHIDSFDYKPALAAALGQSAAAFLYRGDPQPSSTNWIAAQGGLALCPAWPEWLVGVGSFSPHQQDGR